MRLTGIDAGFGGTSAITHDDFHDLDDLFENFIPSYDELWLFGAGVYGKSFQRYLQECEVDIAGFVLSCPNATSVRGKPVLSIEEFNNRYNFGQKKLGILLTIDEKYYDEVLPCLKPLGKDLHVIKQLHKKMAVDRCSDFDICPPTLVFNISDQCNLSCYGCSAASPIVKDVSVYSFENYKRDISVMKNILKPVPAICFTGGECLLNPELMDFAMLARQIFPDAKIAFNTNGILLNELNDTFWQMASDYRIEISFTLYPIKYKNLDEVVKKAESYGVELFCLGDTLKLHDKTSWHFPLTKRGSEKKWDFLLCALHRRCGILIKNGIMHICGAMRRVEHINAHFDSCFPLADGDFIDIYSIRNKAEIELFLQRRPRLCNYCDIRSRHSMGKWLPSKLESSEWIIN